MDKKKVLIAVVTNAAYGLAGIDILGMSPVVFSVGVMAILLAVLSGVHHYFLTDFSRKLDYIGMYGVIAAMLPAALGITINPGIIAALAIVMGLVFGSSRLIVGVLFGLAFLGLAIHTGGMAAPLHVLSWMAVAFVFNFLGDGHLSAYHSLIHGLGWHIPSAYSLLLAARYLA